MMSSDESDNFVYSDDDVDDKKHDKIVQEVLNLNKVQQLQKPSRTEPTLYISEYDLVKSATGNKGSVHVNELTKVLKGRKKHVEIGKKLQSTSKKAATLPKPLEKPLADKIRRTVSYEKNRLELDRWEALVTSNRAALHQSFPLNVSDKLEIFTKNPEEISNKWRLKSDLQKELEQIGKVEEYHVETEKDEFPVTMEEMMEKRKEAAKLRAHQSYKEAKARRQNKIKSKKYHRIQRREKIKQQLKDFEELQKTNPEEALKKLEEIEKVRAEERFSLRHKGTGQWAKNKQIRAKYDKESRQVLAQQLAISRDLTQKLQKVDSDSDDDGGEVEEERGKINIDGTNPWVNGMKPDSEVTDFVSGYRKYWNQKNKQLNGEKDEDNTNEEIDEFKKELANSSKTINEKNTTNNNKEEIKEVKTKTPKSNKKTKSLNDSQSTSEWEVSLVENKNNESLEDLFDTLEHKLKKKVESKLNKIKKPEKKRKKKAEKKKIKQKIDLSIKTKPNKPKIDEALDETAGDKEDTNDENEINALKNIIECASSNKEPKKSDVDPEKFMNVKATTLDTAIPDILTEIDNEEENNKNDIMMEAFEDDDIVDDFVKEKAEEIEKDKPKDIDLTLPGWGEWGGKGIEVSKRKKRRFIIKMPAKMPRKDDNKGSLIINEKAQVEIKKHMVSEVPFPFKTVKDFEASIRAPVGNTFVTETAFKRLTKPAVSTKMGAVIEPITKNDLMGKKK